MPDKITRNYEITGEPAQLNVLEFLFKQIWYLGMIGSSRKIELYVDGDGAVQLKFKRDGIDVRDLTDNKDLGYGVIKYDENDANYPWYFDLGDNMQDEDSEIQELKKLLEHDLIQKVIIGDKRLIVKLRPTSFVQNVINLFEHFKKVLKKEGKCDYTYGHDVFTFNLTKNLEKLRNSGFVCYDGLSEKWRDHV